ncbi:uncharacterized protein LOC117475740 isoform X4 [Trematomus bernacchii]|uniref:uncharacterized protein LOC117475740 isoform X4 n=1 Tax=Trematomus bernacchii TaxID=40690 RepID=UPI00146A8C1B|nr:uncharacterized protein LOC117475740 isoform X4 [Trematomus bernacchii]
MTYSQTEETIIQYGTLEEILEQGLAYGRHDSVGHNDCQPLLGPVSDPNPSLDPLTMQTDRSRQQDPQVPESEEMSSSPPTEPEPSSPQREKDQHQEDRPSATDSNSMTSTTANKQIVSTANLIPITMDNEAIKVSDKKSSINREMKRNLGIEETSAMPPSLKRRLKDQDNQYAAEMKGGEIQMFDEVQRSDVATHTESILCEHIDETLQRRPTEVKNNDLNTHYSPCSMREGDIDPTDLNPIDQFDVNVSVGHDDCQPLHGLVSYPNLTDRSTQQDPQVPESQEMSSSTPTEPEPSSPQREKDQHQEDRPGAIHSNSGTSTTANKQNMSTANLIPITMDNEAIKVSDKKSSINREMKRNLGIEETSAMPPSLKRRLKDQDNQYAAEMKGGEIQMFDEVQRSDVATHTESILCEHIDETLQRRPTEVKNNDLNTHYSPCSMREGDIDPTDLNPIDQFDVNVSVGHDDCQPLHGLVSYPNLTDRSTQQDPQVPESEEMSSSTPTEPEPSSPQREEDQLQEHPPCATDSNSMTSTTANKQNMSTANLIPNYSMNNWRQSSLKPKYSKRYMDNSEQQTNVSDKKQLSPTEIMTFLTTWCGRPLPKHHLKDHHQEDRIPRAMNNYKKLIQISDKNLLFNHVMTLNSEIEEGCSIYKAMPPFLKLPLMDQDNQYAFGAIEMKSGEIQMFNVIQRSDVTTHTERVLCTNIDETLQLCGIEVKNIYMFTLNSPCLMREHKIDKKDKDKKDKDKKDKNPCMLHLVEKARQWHSEFGINTIVFFKKPWGLNGPDIFKDLLYSEVSCTSSAFHLYVDLCKEHRFTLDNKFRQDNKAIFRLIGKVKRKEKLKKTIESILSKLQDKAEKRRKKSQHLENGREYIKSLTFPPEVHDEIIDILTNNWDQMVNDSSMSLIIQKITSYFNIAVVKLFVRDLRLDLGNSGFFQIYQVPPGPEVEE